MKDKHSDESTNCNTQQTFNYFLIETDLNDNVDDDPCDKNEHLSYCFQTLNFSYVTQLSQGSKFIFGLGSTCATRCKFLGALPKF